MKTVGIFTPRPAIDINYRCTTIDSLDNLLFTGDDKGNLYRLEYQHY